MSCGERTSDVRRVSEVRQMDGSVVSARYPSSPSRSSREENLQQAVECNTL